MPTRRQLLHQAAALAGFAVCGRAWSQAFPTRPIRLLVGFAAGGNFDIVARTITPILSERLRQPVVVENRPGASGSIATEAMIRSSADGHTLLLCGAVNAVNATLHEKLPFDFVADTAAVGGVVRFPNVLTVGPAVPVNSITDLVAYARANPDKLSQGSSGEGTTQHLAGELFKMLTDTRFVHVPYRGASQAITELLGGRIQLLFEPLPASLPFIRSGKLRALGVTTAKRVEMLPDVPAIGEVVPGFEASGWTGVSAPRGTPVTTLDALNTALEAALADASVQARFTEMGAATMPGTRAEFAAFVTTETGKWAKVVRAAGIKPA